MRLLNKKESILYKINYIYYESLKLAENISKEKNEMDLVSRILRELFFSKTYDYTKGINPKHPINEIISTDRFIKYLKEKE